VAGKYGRFSQKTGRGSLPTLTAYGLAFTDLLHLRTRCWLGLKENLFSPRHMFLFL